MSGAVRLCYAVASPDVPAMPIAWVGPPAGMLTRLAELGYQGVEVQLRDPAAFDTAAYDDLLRRTGLRLASVSTGPVAQEGLSLTAADPAVREAAVERLLDVLDYAGERGASVAVGSIRGRSGPVGDRERTVAVLRRSLDPLVRRAADRGVRILVEPQSRTVSDLFTTVGEALDFVAEYDPAVVALEVDTFHAAAEEPSVGAALVRAHRAGRLAHVHVADTNRTAPGGGHLPWAEVLGVLGALGYRGWISVEAMQLPSSLAAATGAKRLLDTYAGLLSGEGGGAGAG